MFIERSSTIAGEWPKRRKRRGKDEEKDGRKKKWVLGGGGKGERGGVFFRNRIGETNNWTNTVLTHCRTFIFDALFHLLVQSYAYQCNNFFNLFPELLRTVLPRNKGKSC